jgi:general transcription factor 3C polypeptide 5 (transcription factor C subunit 1)
VLLTQLKNISLHPKKTELKTALSFLSYNYRDGPWKNAYVRLGYNPKANRSSVIYQIISLKLKPRGVEDY